MGELGSDKGFIFIFPMNKKGVGPWRTNVRIHVYPVATWTNR
jgi:hypothetical protein